MNTGHKKSLSDLTCWISTSGWAGTEKPCIALATALGFKPIIKRLTLRFPWRFLPESLWFFPLKAYSKSGDSLNSPWPDVIIGSGRYASAALAKITKIKRNQKTVTPFTIQIQDPRLPSDQFDAVVAPYHSQVVGGNVISTHGSLHGITPMTLKENVLAFKDLLDQIPSPRVAVLIGGKNPHYKMTPAGMYKLGCALRDLYIHQGVGLMISKSRRTEPSAYAAFKEGLGETPAYFWEGQEGPNPYLAFLGAADYILVTQDSVSMVTEACATGKPVYTIDLIKKRTRLDAFHQLLQEKNLTRPFKGVLENFNHRPLDDLQMVTQKLASQITRYFKL